MRFFSIIFLTVCGLCCGTVRAADADTLHSGDTVDIRVSRHDELGGRFIVGGDGSVSLIFIGKVTLGGLSAAQAGERIEALYRDGWLRKPQVSVNISEFARTNVTVNGAVNTGGGFSVSRNKPMTFLSAIGMAGGFTNRANEKAVLLTRGGKTFQLNAKEILEDPAKDVRLIDGDLITVKESNF